MIESLGKFDEARTAYRRAAAPYLEPPEDEVDHLVGPPSAALQLTSLSRTSLRAAWYGYDLAIVRGGRCVFRSSDLNVRQIPSDASYTQQVESVLVLEFLLHVEQRIGVKCKWRVEWLKPSALTIVLVLLLFLLCYAVLVLLF